MINILLTVAGLLLTITGAGGLVSGATELARRLKIPDIVIGLTIVAIGTSTPELIVSVVSATNGNTGLALGNVLGSNLANILLILGVSALIFPLTVQRNTQHKEIPLGILAALVLFLMASDRLFDDTSVNIITRTEGLVLLCFFLIFLFYTFQIARAEEETIEEYSPKPLWLAILYVVGGIAGLYFGGNFFVKGAVAIAQQIGMSEATIGVTIVAVGTSLPELATSVVAAVRKNPDMAVGNVIGSNILNIFLILGITATINPIPVYADALPDMLMVLYASALLFASTYLLHARKIVRGEALLFLVSYIAYITYIIINQ